MKSAPLTTGAGQRKLFFAKWFITGCIILLRILPAQSQSVSGKQIFERMLRVYAEANTYQDQGRVQTDFYDFGQTEPKIRTIQEFTTAYNRPADRFRFQYETQNKSSTSTPEKMVIWSQGTNVQVWWTIWDSTSREASLGEALAIATGVSGTASRKVPYLLMPRPTDAGWGIDSLQNVKLIGTDTLDKNPCYQLTGRLANAYWKNKVISLWIDQKTFLLRRVDEADSISKTKQLVKKSLTYQPVLNQPIPEEALTFEPPPRVDKPSFKLPPVRDKLYILISLIGVSCLIYLLSRRRKQNL